MPQLAPPTDRLEKLFHRRKCWMLAELAPALDYALIAVRRLLNQIGYFRSYTHNGKWYTLRASPQFNREGLWHYRGRGFSKHGSLTATITHLVGRSPAGLSARELAGKLQHPCQAVLSILHKDGALDRLKVGAEFRYLALQEPVNRQQRERLVLEAPPAPATALNTSAAVLVLVEHLKHPDLSFEQLAVHLLQQRQLSVTADSIGRFFTAHDLKKTPEPPIPRP